ncbi:hypothetical protein BH23CHL7_BH23CHL7_16230 [soil metagenome]
MGSAVGSGVAGIVGSTVGGNGKLAVDHALAVGEGLTIAATVGVLVGVGDGTEDVGAAKDWNTKKDAMASSMTASTPPIRRAS